MDKFEFRYRICKFLGIEIKTSEQLKKAKFKGNIYFLHLNDKDNTLPIHAHDYENNIKVDLETGNIINKKITKIVGQYNKKDLKELRKRLS